MQIELLASACQVHEPVRLELSGSDAMRSQSEGHLLACDRGSVLVELAGGAANAAPTARVSARFGHRGRRFSFSTIVQSGVSLPAASRERLGVRLAMPLVLRERAARTTDRIRAAENAPTFGELLVVGPETRRLRCRIVDVASGGVGCELAAEDAGLMTGHAPLIRLRAVGADAPRECEFIVRVAHAHAISEQEARVGLAFVGLDDAAELDARLRRLQDWISGAACVAAGRFETQNEGDRGPC